MIDLFLYKIFPYLVLTLFVALGVYRYRVNRFSFSSISSEFFEKKLLFFGSVPWHYGIIIVILWHITAFLFPSLVLLFNSDYSRLFFLEIFVLGAGFLAMLGISVIFLRRIFTNSVRVNSTLADWLLLIVLIFQVISGIIISVSYRWGINWFASNVTPYLWSLIKFSPDSSFVENLPFLIKLHFFSAFLLILIIPFTKLVHLLAVPLSFSFRQNIIVKWNR